MSGVAALLPFPIIKPCKNGRKPVSKTKPAPTQVKETPSSSLSEIKNLSNQLLEQNKYLSWLKDLDPRLIEIGQYLQDGDDVLSKMLDEMIEKYKQLVWMKDSGNRLVEIAALGSENGQLLASEMAERELRGACN